MVEEVWERGYWWSLLVVPVSELPRHLGSNSVPMLSVMLGYLLECIFPGYFGFDNVGLYPAEL